MALNSPSLKGRALRWLAQREHSRAELGAKLLRHLQQQAQTQAARQALQEPQADQAPQEEHSSASAHISDDDRARVESLLSELVTLGLLSDERAAASVLASQAPRGGHRRLEQALRARRLPPELIESTLARARPNELERARALWRRRFGHPPADAAERARQMRFLAGRGFDGDTVRRVVQAAQEDDLS